MNIAFCDDESVFLSKAEKLVMEFSKSNKHSEIQVKKFISGEELLNAMSEGQSFDGYFLDIELPGIDGYELAKTIRQKDKMVPIVFVSNYDTYLREGYEIGLYRYLKKPLMKEDLFPCLMYCMRIRQEKQQKFYVQILTPKGLEKEWFSLREVITILCKGHIIYLKCVPKEVSFSIHTSFSTFLKEKMGGQMIQCNQSEAVNPFYIGRYKKGEVILKDGIRISVTRKFRKEVEDRINRYFSGEEMGGA